MKNLFHIQTLLVVIFSLLYVTMSSAQLNDPIVVNVKNSGSSYTDQFPAGVDYAYDILENTNENLGLVSFNEGVSTLKFMFTPEIGAVGSTDITITYFTASAPMHPVTKQYRINVSDEIVIAGNDQFVVEYGAIDFPLDVLRNDSATSGPLTISTVSIINAGTAQITAEGDSLLFTPDPEFIGDTWIQYIVCDTLGNCSKSSAHILVADPDNDQLAYHKFLLNQEELEVLTPEPDYNLVVSPSNGTIDSINAITWNYTPDEGFEGLDTFRLEGDSGGSLDYVITVYEKAINAQAKDDKFYVRPGLTVNFNVLNNDLLEFDMVSFTEPNKGELTDMGEGAFSYTPNTGFRGVDKFTYTTCFQDTVYCETATVLLHVTDLEPDNVFSYRLQTTQDLPMAIDYPIVFTDFSYIITDDPDNGILMDYVGLQTIELPCDTVDRFNMLVYEPEAGFVGQDHFEYYYCVQPSNICYLVKVDIDVIEAPEEETCPCIIDCVWPGDADQDGRVDMNDLLVTGYQLGETGSQREYTESSLWFGQHADEWEMSDGFEGSKYIDGNGDGVITADDVDIIDAYYKKTHDVVARDVQQKLPYQFSLIPVQFSLDSGDVVILDVAFGNSDVPVLDMIGAKFSVNIPQWMLDSSSVEVTWHQDSWLAEGGASISLAKVPWDGQIDAGFSKANGNGASGFGVIATIVFIIEDDLEGFKSDDDILYIPISLQAGASMGENGTGYDINGDEVILTYDLGKQKQNNYKLVVYPNPANDIVNIHLNGKTTIENLTVVDPQGRIIEQITNIGTKQHQLNVNALPDGLYYIQVEHTHGVMTQLLSVIR